MAEVKEKVDFIFAPEFGLVKVTVKSVGGDAGDTVEVPS